MYFKALWNDDVRDGVIAGVIAGVILGGLGAMWAATRSKWWQRISAFWSIKLTITNTVVSYQAGAGYPLKCHVEMRNDSSKAVEVRLFNYSPNKITLKSFPPEVMQVRFDNKWFPIDPVDRVGVLPGQLCRAWIGLDEAKFNEVQVKAATGGIGTLIVAANKKYISFQL